MTSLGTLRNANKLALQNYDKTRILNEPLYLVLLQHLLSRGEATPTTISDELKYPINEIIYRLSILKKIGFVYEKDNVYGLSQEAHERFGNLVFSFDHLIGKTLSAAHSKIPNPLVNSYLVIEAIGRGATSVTFKVEQLNTYKKRTLKIFFPGSVKFELLDEALRKRSSVDNGALPSIIDAGQLEIEIGKNKTVVCSCVVLKYIEGDTFADFLKGQRIFSTDFNRFIERVGGALEAIEKVGLSHGDLHEPNILVPPQRPDFWVIDFIGIPSSASKELHVLSDMENFKNHLIRATMKACEMNPGVSASRLLGAKAYNVLQKLRVNTYKNFIQLMEDFNKAPIEVPLDFFNKPEPKPFEWLRVEQINDVSSLFKLFVPSRSIFDTITRFGNTWISGPAGCGKSHYLRVLDFFPSVLNLAEQDEELMQRLKDIDYDYRRSFGVMFPCRLGEFKIFSPETIGKKEFDSETQRFLKHILVLKIINKTFVRLRKGIEEIYIKTGQPILIPPSYSEMSKLGRFITERLGVSEVLGESTSMNIFYRCFSVSAAFENLSIASWNDPIRRDAQKLSKLLDETDLDDYFKVIQETFEDLHNTRFFILVDDASYGQIHFEMQKVLNSLVRSSQSHHCFKITCDRYMYTMSTSDGRSMTPGVEGTHVDLSEVSAKINRGGIVRFSDYMASVVDRRLKAAKYEKDIRHILGHSQEVKVFLNALSQPRKRKSIRSNNGQTQIKRYKAYYAGWNIISNLSHGSVRILLELLEYIFNINDVSSKTVSISLKDQDVAVRGYSDRKFRALSMLPGEIGNQALGECLQNAISAIGEVSRRYLQDYNTGDEGRWYETITIERLDKKNLEKNAEIILEKLIEFNLLVDEGVSFSRAQFGLSRRFDMNKIFAPAFETTYRVRNHMYLSRKQFSSLLLHPDEFVRAHRKKLEILTRKQTEVVEPELFETNHDTQKEFY